MTTILGTFMVPEQVCLEDHGCLPQKLHGKFQNWKVQKSG